MKSNNESSTTQKGNYHFALSPGLELTITFVETTNVKLTVINQDVIIDANLSVPTQTTDSNGHPQMVYGSSSSHTVTYPELHLEIACDSGDASHWLQTELKVKNGYATGPEPECGQATVGIIPGEEKWVYLENEKHRNWIRTPTSNRNFIAISPPQKTAGIIHQYQELNPNVVSLLDVVTPTATAAVPHPAKNFLFRGNEPLTAPKTADGLQTVDFKGLHTIMSKRFSDAVAGENFPAHRSDYLFHDVCLRNPNRDDHQETHAFAPSTLTPLEPTLASLTGGSYQPDMWLTSKYAPNGAKMCWWPIEPSAPHFTDSNFLFYLDQWAGKTLHELMSTAHKTPHVYYIHCANGHDRTGLVAYSYFIARGESQKDAYILGSTVCVSADNPASCVSLQTDRTPEAGSPAPISQTKTRIFPGGGSGPYFETIKEIGKTDSMSWGDNDYVDKAPYGVFECSQF